MIVYNVTFSVDQKISGEWMAWMKESHFPDVLKRGFFTDCKILKVLTHEDDDTFSFAVQYYSNSLKNVEAFVNSEPDNPFGDRAVGYPTLLEEV